MPLQVFVSMALIDHARLLKLPVFTKRGLRLGRVVGFELDAGRQAVVRWQVRPHGLAARVVRKPLLVAAEQVIDINEERMLVEDGVEKAVEIAKARAIGLVSGAEARYVRT